MIKKFNPIAFRPLLIILLLLFTGLWFGSGSFRLLATPAHSGVKVKPALLPMPSSLTWKEGEFRLDESFSVGGMSGPEDRAFKAAVRFMQRLSGRTGLFLKQDYLLSQKIEKETKLIYRYERKGKLQPGEDESYTLEVKPGSIELMAPTDIGIVRGFETLLQLLCADDQGYYFPAVEIKDKPRFTWRGLLIDSCRHFMPLEVIKRNLLAMAAVKLNVLHWHLSEDQGFRVESKTFPLLHQLGSDGMYYTQEQVREVISLASDLGIRVMPEFDIPGHSTSWFVGYPELASAPGPYYIERRFGVFKPVFNPTRPEVYQFFDKFFKEMARLFPDQYVHIGGDEVEAVHWKENPEIQAFMKKHKLSDNHALQAYFNREILKILTRHNKKMVGWDEIYQPGLPKDIVIQSWRGTQALVDGARKGYQGILSNGYYIDLCETAERHYLNDPIPPDSPLTENEKKLILGGEATMWAELISPETVDSRIWPRTAAIAERLWSPSEVRDVDDMYERLKVVSRQLEETGVQHLKNQEMMLRRLAGSEKIDGLKKLARLCEPVKGYARHSQGRQYTSLAPLTRFVDACFPESLEARDFRKQMEKFLKQPSPEAAGYLYARLVSWKGVKYEVEALARTSPVLLEVLPLAEILEETVDLMSRGIEWKLRGQTPDPAWVEAGLKKVEQMKKPQAECQVALMPALDMLLKSFMADGQVNN